MNKDSNYDKVCEHCDKVFNIREGEGWGRSYIKPNAMLPSTIYECNKCINKEEA